MRNSEYVLGRWKTDVRRFFIKWANFCVYALVPSGRITPEAFFVNPWIGEHLKGCEPGGLRYFVDQWLDNEPLPAEISADPRVEDRKVKDLAKLYSALNR